MAEETEPLTPEEQELALTWARDIRSMDERAVSNKFVQMIILHEGNLNKIAHTFQIMLTAHTIARISE